MGPGAEVRAVAPAEYVEAGAVAAAAYLDLPGGHMSGGYEAELRDVGRRAAGADVLVAVEAGAVLGCVTYVPDRSSPWAEGLEDGEAAIRMLAVEPGAQGRGVGAALLDACVDRARAAGRAGVFLHSTPWMPAAHRLYTTAGFSRVPERDWLGVPEVPLLAFRLALAAA